MVYQNTTSHNFNWCVTYTSGTIVIDYNAHGYRTMMYYTQCIVVIYNAVLCLGLLFHNHNLIFFHINLCADLVLSCDVVATFTILG